MDGGPGGFFRDDDKDASRAEMGGGGGYTWWGYILDEVTKPRGVFGKPGKKQNKRKLNKIWYLVCTTHDPPHTQNNTKTHNPSPL